MKRELILLSIGALSTILFCGCTEYWYCPNRSFTRCKTDYDNCVREMECYADLNDRSTSYSEDFIRMCMKEKGYRLVGEDKLPMRAKRLGPDYVIEQRYQGIAGMHDASLCQTQPAYSYYHNDNYRQCPR